MVDHSQVFGIQLLSDKSDLNKIFFSGGFSKALNKICLKWFIN